MHSTVSKLTGLENERLTSAGPPCAGPYVLKAGRGEPATLSANQTTLGLRWSVRPDAVAREPMAKDCGQPIDQLCEPPVTPPLLTDLATPVASATFVRKTVAPRPTPTMMSSSAPMV